MLKQIKHYCKKGMYRVLSICLATIGKRLLNLLLRTCQWEIQGLDQFCKIAAKEKCILMLWHNRLAIAPFILDRYTPQFFYAAFISNSRDGNLISTFVQSYKKGSTIRVPHHSRHHALRELIQHLNVKKNIVVITPDGPRGPLRIVKPGIALVALETRAHVVPLHWEASRFWEFNTWDRLRLPKPFSKIYVSFESPIQFTSANVDLKSVQKTLQHSLPA